MKIRLTTGKSIQAPEGQSILDALKADELYISSSCGGKGTCGKCRVRLIEGRASVSSYGKLTQKERDEGIVLACRSIPEEDMLIEIPETSRLVVGEKIAISRSGSLSELFGSFGAGISPLVKKIDLILQPPSITDNIGDIDRIRRALSEKGIAGMKFPRNFAVRAGRALREAKWNITLSYSEGPDAVSLCPSGERPAYGISVDVGTTTVVLYLVDMKDGSLIDVGSTYNSQIRYGDDVITRIVHATEGGGLDELKDAVVGDINDLIRVVLERHNIDEYDVESAVVSGNTTMSHLLWGLDPASIREEPYIPSVNFFPLWRAGSPGLRINPGAPVYTMPCVASYVGGDIVSGVLASRMHRSEEIALFMDIGTNGEIVVGNNEWLISAACSAGPCFEGSGIRHGMRATEGAIEAVRIDHETFEPSLSIIGGAPPIGICGSGMIDAVSEMFLTGIIDPKGKFVREKDTWRLREGAEGMEYVFCRGKEDCGQEDVTLTEADIENIIRAKAAIYAGVSLLLKEVGFTLDAIERVYIAGGFGNYLNVDRAILLGMLPDMPEEKFSFLGNTSIAGAYLCLLSGGLRKEAEDIASMMTYMELSVSRGFMDEYLSALFLPHTDINKFPTVKNMLGGRQPGNL
jgi:uncharacterized 2Fe-2S/4Fe-4S cluster protein (DUF4445 family)